MKQIFLIPIFLTVLIILTGCNTIGMLLSNPDFDSEKVYRSSDSKKNYFSVKAITLGHCGCTYLSVDNYVNKKKTFTIYYNYNNETGKRIYSTNKTTGKEEIKKLIATTSSNYSVAFDAADIEIFKRIDSIAIEKPKGVVYPIKRQQYLGYNYAPTYSYK